ncbi:WhiB family transcriptional regulator [Nocardia brasiliensis]|uniref:WhiB family transcriptional regulator n=1 Tax=Nocardia brasiliensis TaxID=37326 RepID=UPI00245567BA|nr:WhiB family transcriptional regulator [Nocardia brasiliensis]
MVLQNNTVEKVDEIDPETEARARREIARRATDPDDEARLLAMLGLGEAAAKRFGCFVCGGPLPLTALSAKTGMAGCCSAACKRQRNNPDAAVSAAPASPARTAPAEVPAGAGDEEPDPLGWRMGADCADPAFDPETWFPVGTSPRAADAARDICRDCPVLEACGAEAARHGLTHGVWAGHHLDRSAERKALWEKYSGAQVEEAPKKRLECPQCGHEYTERPGRDRCQPCTRGMVPADASREHIERLCALRARRQDIADAAGLPLAVIRDIRGGYTRHVWPEVEQAICTVTGIGSAVPA